MLLDENSGSKLNALFFSDAHLFMNSKATTGIFFLAHYSCSDNDHERFILSWTKKKSKVAARAIQ